MPLTFVTDSATVQIVNAVKTACMKAWSGLLRGWYVSDGHVNICKNWSVAGSSATIATGGVFMSFC